MKNKLNLILIIGGVAVAGLLLWAILTTIQLTSTRTELNATKIELADTQSKLNVAEGKLIAANNELADTKTALASNKVDLTATKTTLATTQTELTNTEQKLSDKTNELITTQNDLSGARTQLSTSISQLTTAQQTVTTLQNTLTQTQTQLSVAQSTLRGLGVTINESKDCTDVVLVDNPKAVDPTYAQLMTFLAQDTTENHAYIANVYDCSQFSRDLHNHAEAAGIRCAEVQLWFTNSSAGHALDAFLTTDYGLGYVDCTGSPDTFSRVKLYKVYRGLEVYKVPPADIRNDAWWDSLRSYYYISDNAGNPVIVESITIYW